MKLIKLTDTHYVIVDDTEIKEGDWYINKRNEVLKYELGQDLFHVKGKITHSTEPLNDIEFKRVKTLSLNTIKGLISEVDVKELSKKYSMTKPLMYQDAMSDGFIDGYHQSLKDNEEKKYTLQDMINAYREGTNAGALHERLIDYDNGDFGDAEQYSEEYENSFIQSLQRPKTEWEVEFDKDGKLKLN